VAAFQFHRDATHRGTGTLRYSNEQATPLRPNNMTREIEENIYEAFKKIHEAGVVHNDVRLDNILVSAVGGPSVWIIDFEYAGPGDDCSYEMELNAVKDLIEDVRRGETVLW
jgi:tRNA A-37 threonylcarbamoyl transferase component Bud32